MLTRLKVSGFKNLVDVDVSFGAFTCVAGPNAVGKSNLFDAIRFLGYLADQTFIDAALAVRSEDKHVGDIRSLFHRDGHVYTDYMTFEAEMIIPPEGIDDLGQKAKAATTFVRYKLVLRYKKDIELPLAGVLELVEENLESIEFSDDAKNLQFPYSSDQWHKSVLNGHRDYPFIWTLPLADQRLVYFNRKEEKHHSSMVLPENLQRTVLSTVNYATETPTIFLARQEMRSWRLFQLEPSAMREPDRITQIAQAGLLPNGAHLPATLYQLANVYAKTASTNGGDQDNSYVYDQVAARLSELIDGVRAVQIDRDDTRQLLSVMLTEKDGTSHSARSLSDGTLRFLVLSVLEMDQSMSGVICMEEPENGIHPKRIPAMIRLLQDIACDVDLPIGGDNPLRQVIVNTHSPVVVSQIPEDSLLVAMPTEKIYEGRRIKSVRYSWLPDTWRSEAFPDRRPIAKGVLLSYLSPSVPNIETPFGDSRRVIDRPDLQMLLPFND
ncbi:MAG: AAA family ATPase [Chloroflexota bacterium]